MLTKAKSPPHLVTLVAMSALSILSLNMFLPSLSVMADDWKADYAVVSISFTGYLLVTAILQLFAGPVSDRHGRRPVAIGALCIYVIASLGCAVASDLTWFLGFRLLQAAVAVAAVLAIVVIRDTTSPQEAASRIGYVSMVMAIAPMIGPMIGGFLTEAMGWRANFYVFLGLGLVVLGMLWADLGETNTTPSKTYLSQFLAYPDLIRSRRFWAYAVCNSLSVGAFFVFISSVPLIATNEMELTPGKLGVLIGAITAGFMLGNFLTGRFARHFALTTMMIAGRMSGLFGMTLGFIFLFNGALTPLTLGLSVVFVGLGNGLTLPSSNAGLMSVRPNLAGSAAGLSGAMTVTSGAILSSLATGYVAKLGGPAGMFALMSICISVGLAASLLVRRIDASESSRCYQRDRP